MFFWMVFVFEFGVVRNLESNLTDTAKFWMFFFFSVCDWGNPRVGQLDTSVFFPPDFASSKVKQYLGELKELRDVILRWSFHVVKQQDCQYFSDSMSLPLVPSHVEQSTNKQPKCSPQQERVDVNVLRDAGFGRKGRLLRGAKAGGSQPPEV